MATQQAVVPRNRRPRGQHPRSRDPDGRKRSAKKLPEYLEAHQVEALIRAAPNPRARLLFLIEWRAGPDRQPGVGALRRHVTLPHTCGESFDPRNSVASDNCLMKYSIPSGPVPKYMVFIRP